MHAVSSLVKKGDTSPTVVVSLEASNEECKPYEKLLPYMDGKTLANIINDANATLIAHGKDLLWMFSEKQKALPLLAFLCGAKLSKVTANSNGMVLFYKNDEELRQDTLQVLNAVQNDLAYAARCYVLQALSRARLDLYTRNAVEAVQKVVQSMTGTAKHQLTVHEQLARSMQSLANTIDKQGKEAMDEIQKAQDAFFQNIVMLKVNPPKQANVKLERKVARLEHEVEQVKQQLSIIQQRKAAAKERIGIIERIKGKFGNLKQKALHLLRQGKELLLQITHYNEHNNDNDMRGPGL